MRAIYLAKTPLDPVDSGDHFCLRADRLDHCRIPFGLASDPCRFLDQRSGDQHPGCLAGRRVDDFDSRPTPT